MEIDLASENAKIEFLNRKIGFKTKNQTLDKLIEFINSMTKKAGLLGEKATEILNEYERCLKVGKYKSTNLFEDNPTTKTIYINNVVDTDELTHTEYAFYKASLLQKRKIYPDNCKEKELLQIDDPQELSPQNIEIPGNGKIKMLGAVATNPRQIQKPYCSTKRLKREESPHSDDGVHHVKLYCKCKIPDDGRKMWACDGRCNNWYHPECLNFTAEEAEKIGKLEFWICPDCQPSTVINTKTKNPRMMKKHKKK